MKNSHAIAAVAARQVLDSRAAPTVEADVTLVSGIMGRASVPSGASTGSHEAHELRDHGERGWAGRGVYRAVRNACDMFGPAVLGRDARDQAGLDDALTLADGSERFARLGANAALAISLAAARAAAEATGVPLYRYIAQLCGVQPILPLPMVNLISGGAHAGGNLDIQDVLAMPVGANTYSAALEAVVSVYWALRSLLIEMGHTPLVGDEGGFGPALPTNEDALAAVVRAIERAGLRPGIDVAVALDVAATQFCRGLTYDLRHEGSPQPRLTSAEMIARVEQWVDRYPLISIEDGLGEDDWEGWQVLTSRLGARVQLIGDDLFATDASRVRKGISDGVANAVLVKVNQAGTLSGALDTLRMAREAGYATVVSGRSGETEDDWLADLAVGTRSGQIKVGSVARSERLAKYNRLLRIEEECADMVGYAGAYAFGFLDGKTLRGLT